MIPSKADQQAGSIATLRALGINEIVIVDPACDRYGDFVQAARAGEVGLHFCCDGRSAVRMARRFRADVWLVSSDLPDMSGFDLLEMLSPHVVQGDVDPMLSGARISLGRIGEAGRGHGRAQGLVEAGRVLARRRGRNGHPGSPCLAWLRRRAPGRARAPTVSRTRAAPAGPVSATPRGRRATLRA